MLPRAVVLPAVEAKVVARQSNYRDYFFSLLLLETHAQTEKKINDSSHELAKEIIIST